MSVEHGQSHPSVAAAGFAAGAPSFCSGGPIRRGFTLLEALMASGILLTIVVTVTSAISAGQQHSHEAQLRIVATLAADELLGRITSDDYDALSTWNGHIENAGAMTDMEGNPLPESFAFVGREADVDSTMLTLTDLDVRVRGRTVTVRSFDGHGRTLAEVSRFIPEPQS